MEKIRKTNDCKTKRNLSLIKKRLKNKVPYETISEEIGLSKGSIVKVAEVLGLKYPNTSKLKRHLKTIKQRLKEKIPYEAISEEVGICKSYISKIAGELGLKYPIIRADLERNEEIKKMIKQGVLYETIGLKFGFSRQRVYQIAISFGIHRQKEKRIVYKNLVKKIQIDIKKGAGLNEIIQKHNIDKTKFSRLYRMGLRHLPEYFREKRNKAIVNSFLSGKTAKELIQENNLTNIGTIYRIATQNGVCKYPQIVNRSAGGTSERKKVLKLILKKRDKSGHTFKRITNFLNKKGYRTITGKAFSHNNVYHKYKTYDK